MDLPTARIPERPQNSVAQLPQEGRITVDRDTTASAVPVQLEQPEMTIPVHMEPETDVSVGVTVEPAAAEAPPNVITDESMRSMNQSAVPEMTSHAEHAPVIETSGSTPQAEHAAVETATSTPDSEHAAVKKPEEIVSHQPQPVIEHATTAPEHAEHASPAHEAKMHNAQELVSGGSTFSNFVKFLRTGTNAEAAFDLDQAMQATRRGNKEMSQ